MAGEAKSKDRVVSYAVGPSLTSSQTAGETALASALGEGYRVVDIISTPMGGNGSASGAVVTVLLTLVEPAKDYTNWSHYLGIVGNRK